MSGTLYVVGTPIGNLSDFSPRGVETLRSVDFIAAEDTRVTAKLLNHFEIKKPQVSYYEHNAKEKTEMVADRIAAGESCALVSDAGMPGISDPGELLVKECRRQGIPVVVVPGPTAVISALAISTLPTARFAFEGFLPAGKTERRKRLDEVKLLPHTLIFYEAPHKLLSTLIDMFECLGDREIAICRELTKIYEEASLTTLSGAVKYYSRMIPKGEFVLIIKGADDSPDRPDGLNLAKRLMTDGMKINEAAKEAAKESGEKKSDIYRRLLEEKEES